MKNTQKGVIVPLLIVIIAVLLIGGGAYVFTKNKKVEIKEDVSSNSTTVQQEDNQDVDDNTSINTNTLVTETVNIKILDSVILDTYSQQGVNYKLEDGIYKGQGSGFTSSLDKIVKGDLNGDGYEDALILHYECGGSCGFGFDVVLNQKNGKAKLISGIETPGIIMAGAAADVVKTISIDVNGMITINLDKRNLSDPNGATSNNVTYKYKFSNNSLVKI